MLPASFYLGDSMRKSDLAVLAVLLVVVILGLTVYFVSQGTPPFPHPSPTGGTSSTATAIADACHIGGVTYCALNPDVRQDTIEQTICVKGWTATIRPPVSYTNPLKQSQLTMYASLHPNDPNWTMKGTEEDHRVPLELGGAPRDITNLSPEDHPASFTKDTAENTAKADVCAGRLTLIEAQIAFVKRFLVAYPGYT